MIFGWFFWKTNQRFGKKGRKALRWPKFRSRNLLEYDDGGENDDGVRRLTVKSLERRESISLLERERVKKIEKERKIEKKNSERALI